MRLRPISVLLLAVLLVMVSPTSKLNAQTTTSGGLTDVVTDPSHAIVPDAGVEIKDNAKGTVQSTKTDREGVYGFFFLAPGRYTLTVAHGGFQKESRAVNVLLGPPVSVNVRLQVAKASTSVSVMAEAPLLQAENGDVSTTMNQKQISEVPNPGNDLTYIAQTAPGVIMNTDMQARRQFFDSGDAGQFISLHGGRVKRHRQHVSRPDGRRSSPSAGPEPNSGSDRGEHRLLRPVRRRCGWKHQLHHQVGRQ